MDMAQKFTVIVEEGQDGYLISEVIELPGCHTQAKSMNELLKRTKEAIELYIEAEPNAGVRPKFVGLQQLEVEV